MTPEQFGELLTYLEPLVEVGYWLVLLLTVNAGLLTANIVATAFRAQPARTHHGEF